MPNLADMIEEYLLNLLSASGELSIQRNNLAAMFRCAPSQISYVLETRFTPARGFRVESRRGGGGYIRIVKMEVRPDDVFRVVEQRVGELLDTRTAEHFVSFLTEQGLLTDREEMLMLAALKNVAHPDPRVRDAIRAQVFRHMLLALAGQG